MSTRLKIIYEDDTVAVLEKPPGMDVDALGKELASYTEPFRLMGEELRFGIVHRLDKDTSGVLLAAKTKEAFLFFQRQFQERRVEKEYVCLAVGTVKKDRGAIETLLVRSPADRRKQKAVPLQESGLQGARVALTEYEVMERLPGFTLLRVRPKTGRKHQIRAHLAFLGNPIAGDKLYAFKNQQAPASLTRQFLHASTLAIAMPDGKRKEFRSELPADLKNALEAVKVNR